MNEFSGRVAIVTGAGQPIDMARAILCFLREDLFVTGQTLVVDGGYTMH